MSKKKDLLLQVLLQVCKWIKILIVFFCVFIFAYCTIKWAWCSDDAYHAYIMSKNLINGRGFTPTLGKRVNVSTCPLWTLITTLGMLICPDEYYVGMIFNFLFSWGAFAILIIHLYGKSVIEKEYRYTMIKSIFLVLITSLLCQSKAFISFTTSGLENSLLFFLTSVFLVYYFSIYKNKEYFGYKEIFFLAFIEGAIIFARIDAGLIFLPLCMFAGLKLSNNSLKERLILYVKRIVIAVLGLFPFIIWEVFSLLYYGMLVPNTALSKLNTGFPQYEYYERGIAYYIVTLDWDFIVIAILVLFILLSIAVWGLSKFNQNYLPYFFIGMGVLIYMGYIIYIGGDFMKGRHFTVIFWVSLFSISYVICDLIQTRKTVYSDIILLFIGIGMLFPLLIENGYINNPAYNYAQDVKWNYVDEREEYFPYTGLTNVIMNGKNLIWTCPHRGIQWYAGVNSYEERLYDPLLSRLPAIDNDDSWMVGHMEREFPEGYQETLDSGKNCIVNDSLHEYYDLIFEIINGDIFSIERIKKIIHLNIGDYDYLIDEYILSTST